MILISEAQAILFLQRWQYQNEITRDAVDSYFTFKTYCPELLVRGDLSSLDVSLITLLPKTPDGTNIVYIRLLDVDADKFDLATQMVHLDMTLMSNLYKEGNFNGYVVIVDMLDVPFNVISKLDPLQLKKILFYLQEVVPLRLKAIHYVHTKSFMTQFLSLVKTLVKSDILVSDVDTVNRMLKRQF